MMGQKTKPQSLIVLTVALSFAIVCEARTGVTNNQSALATRVHDDLINLSRWAFDIRQVEKLSGLKFAFARQGTITSEEIYRPVGSPQDPYAGMEYERRNRGKWVGITLSIDRKYCISPNDLNTFFPMGEGVPRANDHFADIDFEIGFGDEDRKIWIVYERQNGGVAPGGSLLR